MTPLNKTATACLFCLVAATAGGPAFLPGDSFKLNADPLAGKVKWTIQINSNL